jgi:phosphoribosyl-ATP pyrophosphohydrolase
MAIGEALTQLETVVKDRLAAGERRSASYVASLAAKGRGKVAQKGRRGSHRNRHRRAHRETMPRSPAKSSDLVFHLSILLADTRPRRGTDDRRRTRPPPRHVGPRRKSKSPPIDNKHRNPSHADRRDPPL